MIGLIYKLVAIWHHCIHIQIYTTLFICPVLTQPILFPDQKLTKHLVIQRNLGVVVDPVFFWRDPDRSVINCNRPQILQFQGQADQIGSDEKMFDYLKLISLFLSIHSWIHPVFIMCSSSVHPGFIQ